MNLLRLCFVLFAATGMVACQKEISFENVSHNNNSQDDLLVKAFTKSLADSTTVTFGYNASKKLITQFVKVEGVFSEGDFRKHITREASGRISSVVDSSLQFGGTWEVVNAKVYYVGATTVMSHVISESSMGKDSSVFTYVGNNVSKVKIYTEYGGTYEEEEEHVFSYDAAGNTTNVKYYTFNSGSAPELQTEFKYNYDNKVNPLKFGAESILFTAIRGGSDYGGTGVGPNNVTREEEIDHVGGTPGIVSTVTYNYKSNGKPEKATYSTTIPGIPIPITSNMTMYYQ